MNKGISTSTQNLAQSKIYDDIYVPQIFLHLLLPFGMVIRVSMVRRNVKFGRKVAKFCKLRKYPNTPIRIGTLMFS